MTEANDNPAMMNPGPGAYSPNYSTTTSMRSPGHFTLKSRIPVISNDHNPAPG